jgi:hypothetical protein
VARIDDWFLGREQRGNPATGRRETSATSATRSRLTARAEAC